MALCKSERNKKFCIDCGCKLMKKNWPECRRKKNWRLCTSCSSKRHKLKYYKKAYKKSREWHLKKDYNITLKQYDQMFEVQNGVCAICGQTNLDNKRLSIDHDHKTGKIRGLLCTGCNWQLGIFEKRFNDFIKYLKDDKNESKKL